MSLVNKHLFSRCWKGVHLGRESWSLFLSHPSSFRVPGTFNSYAFLKFHRWSVILPVSDFLVEIRSKQGIVALHLSTGEDEIAGLLGIWGKTKWEWVPTKAVEWNSMGWVRCISFLLVHIQMDFQNIPRFPSYSLSAHCDCRRYLCFLINRVSHLFFRIM